MRTKLKMMMIIILNRRKEMKKTMKRMKERMMKKMHKGKRILLKLEAREMKVTTSSERGSLGNASDTVYSLQLS